MYFNLQKSHKGTATKNRLFRVENIHEKLNYDCFGVKHFIHINNESNETV